MGSEAIRVLVIEDDADVAMYTKTVLEKRTGSVVEIVTDPAEAVAVATRLRPDVIITDIEMPGISGIELIGRLRAEFAGVPVIMMTAHVSVDYAVSALRNHANEFLTKPVSSTDLVAHVERLAQEYRAALAAAPTAQVVLAIGAHPDDVEVGIGGILAAHSAAGDSVTILTLSRGSRDGGVRTAWTEGSASARVIGARLVLEDVPDAEIGGSEPTVGRIRKVVDEVRPSIVYVHSRSDRSAVHRAVHDATMLATPTVPTVACYQSSTATVEFRPIRFVPIDSFLDAKLEMLACFANDGTPVRYLEPEFVRSVARYWSRFGQVGSCEPLEILRDSAEVV